MSHLVYRRWFGFILCSLIGLAFILVSQTINHIVMPGVPFYQPPLGMPGNILLGLLVSITIALAISLPESSPLAVFIGSLTGAVVISVATLLTGQMDQGIGWRKITAVLLIFVPIVGGVAPIMILLRWIMIREETTFRDTHSPWFSPPYTRLILPAALLIAAAWIGMSFLYNDLGRAATPRMHALIQQGQKANSIEALPDPLKTENVTLFLSKAHTSYTLEWDKDDTNQYQIPRPNTSFFEQSIVIARFDNGYLLVCMFPDKTNPPDCRDFASYEK